MLVISKIRPLSVNEAWQGRRFKTRKYKDYEKELLLTLPKIEKMEGDLVIDIRFYFKYPKKRDIDNCIKPLLDIMQKKGYYKDDRYVWRLSVIKEQRDEEGFAIMIYNL